MEGTLRKEGNALKCHLEVISTRMPCYLLPPLPHPHAKLSPLNSPQGFADVTEIWGPQRLIPGSWKPRLLSELAGKPHWAVSSDI